MSQSAVGGRQSAASRRRRNALRLWLVWLHAWRSVLAAFVACAAYGITLRGGYASDDFLFLYYAAHARWLDIWHVFVPQFATGAPRPGFYRPVGMLVWNIGFLLGGTSAVVQHALNVGLHAANSALVYFLARRLRLSTRISLCSALLFALFPVHAEAVSWLSGRFDLLATGFTLLAIVLTLAERPAARWLGVVCVALALLSKESALALPGLLALVLVWRWCWVAPGPLLERVVWPLVPSTLVLVVYGVWRYALFGGIGGYITDAGPVALTITWKQLQTLISVNITFLTMPLNWARALREANYGDAWSWLVAIGSAVLALISFRAAASRRLEAPSPAPLWAGCAFGASWMLLALVPSLGTRTLDSDTFMGSRVVYLASVGVCVLLACVLFQVEIVVRNGSAFRRTNLWRPALLIVTIILAALTASASARRWVSAGEQARDLVAQARRLYPSVLPQTTFLLQGFPDNDDGAYIFRNGAAEALRLAYGDDTLRIARLGYLLDAPLARPDRVATLVNDNGRLRRPDDEAHVQALFASQGFAPGTPTIRFDRGFFPEEHSPEHVWRWMRGGGCIYFNVDRPEQVDLHLRLWSLGPSREVQATLGKQSLARITVTERIQDLVLPNLALSAGPTCVRLAADAVTSVRTVLGNDDRREVSVAVGDIAATLSPQIPAALVPTGQQPAQFGSALQLASYDLARAPGPLQSEQYLALTLYWRALATPERDLSVFVHLVDEDGRIIAQADGPPGGAANATSTWRADQYWRNTFGLTLPTGIAPGNYRLLIGLYDPVTLKRLPIQPTSTPDDSLVLETLPADDRPQIQVW